MQLRQLVSAALAGSPSQPGVRFNASEYDWGWLAQRAAALAAALAQCRLAPGAPIGFAPRNRPEHAAALLGLIGGGWPVVMLYAYQSHEAIAAKMRALRLPVLIAADDEWGAETLAAMAEIGGAAISLGGERVVLRTTPAADRDWPSAEDGVAFLTSGTTGPPKHFHMSYDLIARAMVTETSVPPADGPPALHYFPFGNIAGIYAFLPLAVHRKHTIMLERFTPQAWLEYVRAYRPALVTLPPAGFPMILDCGAARDDLAGVRYISTGAATLDPHVQDQFEQTYDVVIVQSYGATEFGGVVSAMTPDLRQAFGASKRHSVGRPWAGAQFRVRDMSTGELAPANNKGRLEVLAPRIGSDWIVTNDLALLDDDGFLYHRGRTDGIIVRGGFKITPEAVAEALTSHPAISVAAVVGLADARLGAVPVAAVELCAGADTPSPAELAAHVRRYAPSTHVPVAFKVVSALPRTASLKIDLAAVRALFEPAPRHH